MDTSKHYTHWNVLPYVRVAATDLMNRFGGSWNTYYDHPEGMGLDATSCDHWAIGGRGYPLPEHVGDALVAYAIGEHVHRPIRWLIWWGYWWRPDYGWVQYGGWQGSHKGADAHVHITYA